VERRSLGSKLIQSYLVILALGGITTSLIGSTIVSSTIMGLARRAVDDQLATARTIYDHELDKVRRNVATAAGEVAAGLRETGSLTRIEPILNAGARGAELDFLVAVDEGGRVLARWPGEGVPGATLDIASVRDALAGRTVATTAILPPATLTILDPALLDRSAITLLPTARARPTERVASTSGMVLLAAVPILSAGSTPTGALCGGVLLNRNSELVDRIFQLLYEGETFRGRKVGSVTIFQGDVRIATTVQLDSGDRAVGTRASTEVGHVVLESGETWKGRAFVVNDWYITSYFPLAGSDGAILGMLYVGVLERAYSAIQNRVILLFFVIAGTGFVLIIGVTYWTIRNTTRPIEDLVAATRQVAAGELDTQLSSRSYSAELASLAESFNRMTVSLRRMRADLEESAHTLESRVRERTEELVGMQSKVAQAERLASVGLLAAGVAHEVNNPLGAILALTALTLEDLPPDDPNRENLEEVVEQALRCRDIVRGLLEFSRQSDMRIDRVDVNAAIENTLGLIGGQALFHNVSLIRDFDGDLPPITADRAQLQQVFLNLLVNAAQATEGGGRVSVSTALRTGTDGRPEVEIVISDTGCGIPPEAMSRIFDPFYTTKKEGSGTGLGLAIAYGIVTRHGGSISAESDPPHGTAFHVRLPVTGTAAPEMPLEAEA